MVKSSSKPPLARRKLARTCADAAAGGVRDPRLRLPGAFVALDRQGAALLCSLHEAAWQAWQQL